MSYRMQLCLTHIASAAVAALSVCYGQQTPELGTLVIVVLLAAGIPCAIAAASFTRGLRRMESALTNEHSEPLSGGIIELDQTVSRLRAIHQRQRALVNNVDDLLRRLGHSTGSSISSDPGAENQRLTNALGQISRSTAKQVGTIMASGNTIAKAAHDTNRGAEQQIQSINSAINAVELLSQKIDAIGTDADAVSAAAKNAADRADSGLVLINELTRGMQSIRTNVEFSEKKVASLGQQSEQIGSIVEMMESISARTDMLALNAAIEAVRAGQEGRGFSVVAEEVRRLAESTANASRDIAALVDAIQSEAHDTVLAMTEERHQVLDEIRRVGEAGTALENIRLSSIAAIDRSRQITASTVEQFQRTQEVVRAIQQVSTIASSIRDRNETIRDKSTDLAESAQGLEETLSPMYHFGDSGNSDPLPRSRSKAEDATGRRRVVREVAEELFEAVKVGEFAQ